MAVTNPELLNLPDADRRQAEAVLVQFDLSWAPDRLLTHQETLPPAGSPLRRPVLTEMVKIDLERQWHHGRRIGLEAYLAAFPELGTPATVAADLIQADLEVRRQFGLPADAASVERRFPGRRVETLPPASEQASLATPGPASGTPPPVPAGAPAGPLPEQFGRYRILRELGRGGMGAVYLAQDSQLDRQVALKVPRFQGEDAELVSRFYREARAAAKLHHPNLCPVYDVGQINGTHFLTMAYIAGEPLAHRVRQRRPLPPAEAVALVRKAALAVQAAHAGGVVHRDLKPANIMITPGGEPVIMDFGLAKRLISEPAAEGEGPETRSGTLIGTPAYMAPEQVRGEVRAIGPRSDVYALGVILYQLLTGRLPFEGDLADLLAQITRDPPPPPSRHKQDLDPRLEAVCLRALAKDPADRYASVADFADALAACQPSNGRRPAPPRRAAWLLAGAAVLAVLGVVVGVMFLGGQAPGSATGTTAVAAAPGRQPDPTAPAGAAAPAPTAKAGTGPGKGHDGSVTGVAITSDGQRIVSAGADQTVRQWDVAGGHEVTDARYDLAGPGSTHQGLILAPNGRRFLDQTLTTINLADVERKQGLKALRGTTHLGPRAFAANGRRVVVAMMATFGDVAALVWDLETDATTQFTGHPKLEMLRAVALAADGRLGVSAAQDGVRLWEADSGKELHHLSRPSVTCLAFTPDGKQFLTGDVLGLVVAWDVATGKEAGRWEGHADAITGLAVSADGRRLLSGSADRTVRLWEVAGGKELKRLAGPTAAVTCVALSAAGTMAAAGDKDGGVRWWAVP